MEGQDIITNTTIQLILIVIIKIAIVIEVFLQFGNCPGAKEQIADAFFIFFFARAK
jgi:hypothetical protein